jgi:hypothetical protein
MCSGSILCLGKWNSRGYQVALQHGLAYRSTSGDL